MASQSEGPSNVFPVKYLKAKSKYSYKATRIVSLGTTDNVIGQLSEQAILVEFDRTKPHSERSNKGECYGKCVVEKESVPEKAREFDKVISKYDDTRGVVDKTREETSVVSSLSDNGSVNECASLQAKDNTGSITFESQSFDVTNLTAYMQHLKNCVQLSLEEAFYLNHRIHCLQVFLTNKDQLLATENLWKECCKRDNNFIHKYVVYEHYRKKGWVPKPGTKFGVHFLLYKDGPAYYHSSYGVVVRSAVPQSELTWQFMISLVRVMESVRKGTIVCDVTTSTKMTTEELLCPSCVHNFVVKETLVNRWVPKQDRE
ncbi:uncharacterized protein [Dysidea avara]|uniref:uncharacterized protein n=1 Tax=Dysidea avara TaxID=196820 RepID=UPI00332B157E